MNSDEGAAHYFWVRPAGSAPRMTTFSIPPGTDQHPAGRFTLWSASLTPTDAIISADCQGTFDFAGATFTAPSDAPATSFLGKSPR